MNKKTFSIKESLSFAWNNFKNNWKFWIIVVLLVGASNAGGGGFSSLGSLGGRGETNEESYSNNSNDAMLMEESASGTGTSGVLGTMEEKVTEVTDSKTGPFVIVLIVLAVIFSLGVIAIAVLFAVARQVFDMGSLNLMLDAAREKDLEYKTLLNHVDLKKAWRYLVVRAEVSILKGIGYLFFIVPGILISLKFKFAHYFVMETGCKPREALKKSSKLTKKIRGKLFLFGIGAFIYNPVRLTAVFLLKL